MRMASSFAPFALWLQEHGLFYYRRARIVRFEMLDEDPQEPATDIDVREASEEDLRVLAALQNRDATEWLAKRARGALCLVARSGPTRLGNLWITRSAEPMTEVNHVLEVSRDPEAAYLFDGYVLPLYRGTGVLRTLLRSAKRWSRLQGLVRLYAAFARDNRVSEHALRRAGFVTIVGDVIVLRVLGREWKSVRVRRGASMVDVLSAGPSSQRAHTRT
jgi:GNAT superfamily N-acetyltransferase